MLVQNFYNNNRKLLHGLCLALIIVIALVIRIDFVRSVTHEMPHDAINYVAMSEQLLNDGIYGYNSTEPNAYVTPGYPLFVTINHVIADVMDRNPLTLTRYAQIVLSICTLIMIYILTRKLSGSGIASLAAASVTAIYPPFVWANGAILTEVLGTFFLMGYLLWQLYAFDKLSRIQALIAGIWLGLAVLVRPEFLPVVIVLYALRWWQVKDRNLWKMFLFSLLGIMIMLMPWWVRNMVTLHEFIPLSTQTNPIMAGTFPHKNYEDNLVDRTGKTDWEVTKERLQVGFTEHTQLFVWWFTIGKLEQTYASMYYGGGHSPHYPVINSGVILHQALIALGFASIIFLTLTRFKQPQTLIAAVIIVMSLIRLAFVPEFRYNFPMMPLMIILICIAFSRVMRLLQNRKQRKYDENKDQVAV
jgi:4-amino-4-deoxy-L-arabinose transferase-like glycosyltransferase